MRGDNGVAGEGRVVGIPKFQSWGKFMGCNLLYYIFILYYLRGPFKLHLGV